MRRLFFIALLTLVALTAVYMALQAGGGYVLLAVAGYTVEMSVLVALLLNVLLLLVLYMVFAGFRLLLRTRSGIVEWASDRRRQRGLNRTTQGLIAYVEGRWDYARKSLSRSAGNSSTPLINYLFAARASSEMGDAKAVDEYLRQAELSTEGADIAIGLTQAELQISSGQNEQALATLLRARRQAGHHPVVLGLLARVYRELNDWDSLLDILPALKRSAGMSRNDVESLERQACCAMLVSADSTDGDNGLAHRWKQIPAAMRKESTVVACYAERLLQCGKVEEAERELRQQLQRQFDAELVRLYGLAGSGNLDRQLSFLQKLQKSHPQNPDIPLAAARICVLKSDTEAAKSLFEQSLEASPSFEACVELARLHALEGDLARSNELYARGLTQTALPARLEKNNMSGAAALSPAVSPGDASASEKSDGLFNDGRDLAQLKIRY